MTCLYHQGDFAKCLQKANEYIAYYQNFNQRVWEHAAYCQREMLNYGEAEKLFERLTEKSDLIQHWINYAEVVYKQDNHALAISILQDASKRHPKEGTIYVYLSSILFFKKDYNAALKYAKIAVKCEPENIMCHKVMSQLMLAPHGAIKLNKKEKKLLHQSLRKNPDVKEVQFHTDENGLTESPAID